MRRTSSGGELLFHEVDRFSGQGAYVVFDTSMLSYDCRRELEGGMVPFCSLLKQMRRKRNPHELVCWFTSVVVGSKMYYW
jgi:hypothetical protein